jgi:hypothetical protein
VQSEIRVETRQGLGNSKKSPPRKKERNRDSRDNQQRHGDGKCQQAVICGPQAKNTHRSQNANAENPRKKELDPPPKIETQGLAPGTP